MSPICTGEDSLFTSFSSGWHFHYTEMAGRGGEKGCKIYDFYSSYLFKQSSLKVQHPPNTPPPASFNAFHWKNKGTVFSPFFLLQWHIACRDGLSTQPEGFESSYLEIWRKATEFGAIAWWVALGRRVERGLRVTFLKHEEIPAEVDRLLLFGL